MQAINQNQAPTQEQIVRGPHIYKEGVAGNKGGYVAAEPSRDRYPLCLYAKDGKTTTVKNSADEEAAKEQGFGEKFVPVKAVVAAASASRDDEMEFMRQMVLDQGRQIAELMKAKQEPIKPNA